MGARGCRCSLRPRGAPRVRLRTDLIAAALTSVGLALLILVAGDGSTFDDNALEFVGTLPGWLLWIGQAAYVVGVVYAFGLLIGVGVVARDRLELLRDMIVAALLAVVVVFALTRLIDDRWPDFPFFDLQLTRFTFPAFFITTSTALQAAASPWLTAPMRRIGWTFILVATGAATLGRVTTVSDALGGVLVGLIAAAIVRYLLGTSAGMPSTKRLRRRAGRPRCPDGPADLLRRATACRARAVGGHERGPGRVRLRARARRMERPSTEPAVASSLVRERRRTVRIRPPPADRARIARHAAGRESAGSRFPTSSPSA